jgi:hypothetical protein
MTEAKRPSDRLRILQGGGLTDQSLVLGCRRDRSVIGESQLPDLGLLHFEAENIRRAPTGTHARVILRFGNAVAAWNFFNIERDEDRTRLANSAGAKMGATKERCAAIKLRLDEFCANVWDWWIEGDQAEDAYRMPHGRPSWAIRDYLLDKGGTILYGPPGAGKSWLGLLWCVGLATGASGGPTIDVQRKMRTLFVNLERDRTAVAWRLDRVCRILGVDDLSGLKVLNARGRRLLDVYDAASSSVDKQGIECVVVDSLSRAGVGDLTGNEEANVAMDALNSLAPAWAVLAHTPRSDTTHVYGSIMLEAAADLCIRLTSSPNCDETALGIQLEVTKANDCPKAKPRTIAYEFDDDGLAMVRSARSSEFPDLTAIAVTTSALIADYLRSELTATVGEIAEGIGKPLGTVRRALNTDQRFVRLKDGGRGRGDSSKWGLKHPGRGDVADA